ncbi:Hybrid signal transduction histidine kinase G [Seminavis robusta]|uniref:guanylate cyclase n=1 Tax=Seminavis robusta TaxID=568900 RepID=A0A9N8H9T2_9STRA|nr:Hybrid signal transduction histidine kinase G [Seminavis robusta]|eukprot:Sro217_g089720.1 Hybrid signal transduction histidine kinase G (1737) ;mRNA; r:42402-47882
MVFEEVPNSPEDGGGTGRTEELESGTVSLSSLGKLSLKDFFPVALGITERLHKSFHASGKLHGHLSTDRIKIQASLLLDDDDETRRNGTSTTATQDDGQLVFLLTTTRDDDTSDANDCLVNAGKDIILNHDFSSSNNSNISAEGTSHYGPDLCFVSPEQTGRMQNRTVDHRSDLYSLGVVFYHCLTGNLPFAVMTPLDPMELIHFHIAMKPKRVTDQDPSIPTILADIVDTLLEKNPNDRYQSAQGLWLDLQEAQKHQQQYTTTVPNNSGLRHHMGCWHLPVGRLYGRQTQVQQLITIMNRVIAKGTLEVIWVAGYSGTGKTALVEQTHPTLRISGKFDQSRRVPYHAIVLALQNLVTWLFKQQDEVTLNAWKERLRQAVGNEGRVVLELVPSMGSIIGAEQPAIPELAGKEAQNRFLYVMKSFFRAICAMAPLVLFLDDTQWADSSSLELLQALALDPENGHFLIVGAYRDNEVGPSHPFVRTMDHIRSAKPSSETTIHTILVENLQREHVHLMITDTLHTTTSQQPNVSELTDLTYRKTRGNSFFTRQFLQDLYDQGHVQFDWPSEKWQWNTEAIQQLTSTDNVVDFMAQKLQRLEPNLLECLCTAACVGARFSAHVVAAERGLSLPQTESLLEVARKEGLILSEDGANNIYRFLHDRVQQAALSILSEQERPRRHYSLGKILLGQQSDVPDEEMEQIFEIVDQFNSGLSLVTDDEEKLRLAKLNLAAGKRGADTAAYNSSYVYVSTGIRLVGAVDIAWDAHYDLCLSLYTLAADTAYMSAQFEKMDDAISEVLCRTKTLLEKIPAYRIRILSYKARNKLLDAIDTGISVLKQLDVVFPEPTQENTVAELGKVLGLLENKSTETLLHLPLMQDPGKVASLKLIADINSSVYWARAELFPLIVFKSVELSVLYGNTEVSSFAYGTFGVILSGVVGDMQRAHEFGDLGIKVMDKFNAKDWLAQIYTPHYALIVHWSRHIRETFQPLIFSIHVGLETGAIEYLCINANIYCIHQYLSGQPLEGLETEIEDYSSLMKSFAQETNYNFNQIYHQAVLNLAGRSDDPCKLVGSAYNEVEMLPRHIAAKDNTACFFVYFNKMILCYLFGKYDTAESCSSETEARLSAVLAKLENTSFNFINSLLCLAQTRRSPERKEELLERVTTNQKAMEKWSSDAPMNFLHKWNLVEAEKARVNSDIRLAVKMYKQSVAGASEHGFLNDLALANELAAECLLEIELVEAGKSFLMEAYRAYAKWGALAKCQQLVQRYPEHLSIYSSTLSSTYGSSQYLDMFSVMKSATAIQGDIALGKLLKSLMAVLIENAGADRGCLLLAEKDQLFLQAERDLGRDVSSVLQNIPIKSLETLPQSVVSYVARVNETIVLDSGANDETFGQDPYIQANGPRSILCSPIVLRGKLLAVVYLQNTLISGAFTEERTALLNLLSGQIAISIHNALLYDRLEQKVKERTAAIERQKQELEAEKVRSDELLLNILPRQIANELKLNDKSPARRFSNVTILFSDIVNFSVLSQNMSPEDLVKLLDEYFGAMDEIVASHGVEKIKTIGDAYMCAAGLPVPDPESPRKMIAAAKDMIFFVAGMKHRRAAVGTTYFDIRIGINTGSVVAGVVGIRKFAYDIWGDPVNVAARCEQTSEPGFINISESTYQLVKDQVPCVHRGKIAPKNMKAMDMYFVKQEKRQSNVDMLMRRGSQRREELQGLLGGHTFAEELSALLDEDSSSESEAER